MTGIRRNALLAWAFAFAVGTTGALIWPAFLATVLLSAVAVRDPFVMPDVGLVFPPRLVEGGVADALVSILAHDQSSPRSTGRHSVSPPTGGHRRCDPRLCGISLVAFTLFMTTSEIRLIKYER